MRDAHFVKATFKGNSIFEQATFKRNADFGEAIFEGNVKFFAATFKGNAVFWRATFKGGADFGLKSLVRIIDFSEIRMFSGKKLSIKIFKEVVEISFEHAYLENTDLDIEIVKDTLIDFTGALLKNTKIKKGKVEKHILQEEKKNYYKAKENYLILKNNFHSIGQYDDESWAYKKEKDMERKSNFYFKTLHKWLWSCFLNGIFGYGEQPGKVIVSAILIILLFAFLFMTSGISNVGIEQITSNNFFDCMYFSTVTFTTLGYGDFRPLEGLGRILAGSEAFIGALMMALFVYTFARRTGGR